MTFHRQDLIPKREKLDFASYSSPYMLSIFRYSANIVQTDRHKGEAGKDSKLRSDDDIIITE